ncbi:RimK-like ATPgrasp N-terminal domain-containing protein, partial [Acinetobacter baumannii]|uniref:RimK-like ATPgrasp N-terminal domain-containing protein n=1 Tax=Acinetobacter baumannii TaxID=470 RepID=UPI00286079B0
MPLPAEFSMDIHFGHTAYTPLAGLARSIFATFPVPLMRIEFARGGDHGDEWHIAAIRIQGVGALGERERKACEASAAAWNGLPRRAPAQRRYRY